jgi:hypothetical protein
MGRWRRNENGGSGSKSGFPEKNNQGGKEKKNEGVDKGKDQGSRAYILKEKEEIRKHLRSERKETAARYY